MDKSTFISAISGKLKLIRAERGLSQEEMAGILSISKKTLVEVEKGRSSLSFGNAAAAAVIFEDSEVISMVLGGDVTDSIKSLALSHHENLPRTMGGKVWWREVRSGGGYRVQQNILSGHFRILDAGDRRICSSFDESFIEARFDALQKEDAR